MAKAAAPVTQTPAETEPTPVVETPVVTPAVETPVVETPAANPLLEKFTAAGFEGVTDEKTAAERAFEAWEREKADRERERQEYETNKPFIEYGHKYFQEQQVKPAPAEAPAAEQPSGWWNPPAVDLRAVRHYQQNTVNPTTQEIETTWKPGTPDQIKQAYDDHQLYKTQWAEKFVDNPIEALAPFKEQVRQEVLEEVKALYGETMQQQTQEQFLSTFERDNSDWLFVKDPLTQKPLPSQLTPEAERWFGEAERYRITDPQLICQYALEQRQKFAAQASTPAPTPAQVADEKRRAITARNVTPPNRSGTQLPPENGQGQQNPNLPLRQKLRQDLAEAGFAASG